MFRAVQPKIYGKQGRSSIALSLHGDFKLIRRQARNMQFKKEDSAFSPPLVRRGFRVEELSLDTHRSIETKASAYEGQISAFSSITPRLPIHSPLVGSASNRNVPLFSKTPVLKRQAFELQRSIERKECSSIMSLASTVSSSLEVAPRSARL